MSDPLQGIRVLDLSRVLAGPQCAAMLGDLGADVIKIEVTGSGDESRSWEPTSDGEATAFVAVNRNKRSMAVDLSTDRGRHIVRSLIVQSDVVIENFRTGTMERWGLGYDQMKDGSPGWCTRASPPSGGRESWPGKRGMKPFFRHSRAS